MSADDDTGYSGVVNRLIIKSADAVSEFDFPRGNPYKLARVLDMASKIGFAKDMEIGDAIQFCIEKGILVEDMERVLDDIGYHLCNSYVVNENSVTQYADNCGSPELVNEWSFDEFENKFPPHSVLFESLQKL